MNSIQTHALLVRQQAFFESGETLPLKVRAEALHRLHREILAGEKRILEALEADLGKSPTESYMCEIGMTLGELSYMRRNLKKFAKKKRVPTPLAQFPAQSYTVQNPYGVVLILSPWNYPFLLSVEPLIGAIAAGNCVVLKPSAASPHTGAVLAEILAKCFPPEYVSVVQGGRAENQALLEEKFDMIFFTGGAAVGKEVMRHAAEHLTPVVLELGGKSPCVVDATANLDLAAKRIAFGKLLNCGQTCVAPDYVLVERCAEAELVERLKFYFTQMAGEHPLENEEYVHMVNQKHFHRVMNLIAPEKVALGGTGDENTLRIAPTILRNVRPEDPVMGEEIFGPVLPILVFDTMDEAAALIKSRPRPLACYLFTRDAGVQKRFENAVWFGGGCINDTIIHLATSRLPFGGVGNSGMGSYHGKKSFEAFSHEKSIVKKALWLDLPIRYAPYTKAKEKWIRLFMK